MDTLQSDMLICPQCSGKLQPGPEDSARLDCQNCPLSYPLRDSVPVLVIQQASTRKIETDDEFERLISEALQAPFSGWDFSWLEGRLVQTAGPHDELDYERRAREAVSKATAVLDLGTGGGELLSRLAPFPPIAIATEAYPPNVAVAASRLPPLRRCHLRSRAGQFGLVLPQRGLSRAQERRYTLDLASRNRQVRPGTR